MRYIYGKPLLRSICVITLLIQFAGCDFTQDQISDIDTSVETIRITLESGKAITVRLDPTYIVARSHFATMEDYYVALNKVTDQEAVTVNTTQWNSLKHVLDPFEISLLDSEGKVIVGEYVYSVTEAASYRMNLIDSSKKLEIEVYWGSDGKAVEREFVALYGHAHLPEELAKLTFRNPFIQTEAETLIQNATTLGKTADTYHYEYTGNTTICLPDDEADFPNCYSVRFMVWNQSTGALWYKKAHGGTQAQALIGGVWYGFGHSYVPSSLAYRVKMSARVYGNSTSYSTTECIGTLTPGPLDPNYNPPYAYFTGNPCYDVSISRGRSSGYDATSRHGGGQTDYFRNRWDGTRYYLMFEPTSWWIFSEYPLG